MLLETWTEPVEAGCIPPIGLAGLSCQQLMRPPQRASLNHSDDSFGMTAWHSLCCLYISAP